MNFTDILAAIVLGYLGWAVFYQLACSVAGHFFKNSKKAAGGTPRRFAVLIPAYREDAVIEDTVKAALRQNYPADRYDVVLISDSLQAETLWRLRGERVRLLPVEFEKSTKSKSLNAALETLEDEFDAAAVLDADNHADPDFLRRMDEALSLGCRAAQGCRAAKNGGTAFAQLDGVSEAVNNHLLCKGHRALGLSARLAGSGMAFEFGLFKKVMKTIDALGGFDKELELKLTQLGVKIAYAPDAVVLDEKIDNAGSFARQRGRWLAAQYRYGRRFSGAAAKALVREGNFDFFNKTLQMALPPRLVLPGVLALGALAATLFQLASAPVWQALLAGNFLSFALAIPRQYWHLRFLRSLLQVPLAFASTVKALALMPLASRQFLHTPHGLPRQLGGAVPNHLSKG